MEDKHFKITPPFLTNGGEMGARIQAKDWSKTALGAIENWPPGLCTTLGIVLHAKFPMFLFWGPELLCFYNDAYRPSLGDDGKHPGALGQKAADVWAETWHIIKPIIDQVLTDASASWSEDQLIPIYRNGRLEEVYWTFSYSPVFADSIEPAGVLVVCTETTENVLHQKEIENSKNWLQFAVDGAELAVWDINPFTNTFTGNARLKAWHGLPPGEDFDLQTGFNSVLEADRIGLEKALADALDFSSGGLLDHEYTIVNAQTGQTRIVRAYGKTSFREDQTAYQLNGILQDVTTSAINQKRIEQNEQNLRSMILQAPFAMCILRARDYVVEIVNPNALALLGRTEAAVLNKPILEAMPELRTQGIQELLDGVYATGQRFATTEMPFQLLRNGELQTAYINFSFEPLYSAAGTIDGIMPVGIEVTELVMARRKVEENEQRLNLVIGIGRVGYLGMASGYGNGHLFRQIPGNI